MPKFVHELSGCLRKLSRVPVAHKAAEVAEIVKDESFWTEVRTTTEKGAKLMAERNALGLRQHTIPSGSALKEFSARACSHCGKDEQDTAVILRSCARCIIHKAPVPAKYCSKDCQRAAWQFHKVCCGPKAPPPPPEFDGTWVDQWRGCKDGAYHFGTLELITWDGADEDGMLLGFGGVYLEGAGAMRAKFEGQCGGDLSRFIKVSPSPATFVLFPHSAQLVPATESRRSQSAT